MAGRMERSENGKCCDSRVPEKGDWADIIEFCKTSHHDKTTLVHLADVPYGMQGQGLKGLLDYRSFFHRLLKTFVLQQ